MTEHEYNTACAETDRAERQAAEFVNAILTVEQALALRQAIIVMPEAGVYLAEQAFEVYGWPTDAIDDNWLSHAGRLTMQIYRDYKALVTK